MHRFANFEAADRAKLERAGDALKAHAAERRWPITTQEADDLALHAVLAFSAPAKHVEAA